MTAPQSGAVFTGQIKTQRPRGLCVYVALDMSDSDFAPERAQSDDGDDVADAEYAAVQVPEVPAEDDFSFPIAAIARERAERLMARHACPLINHGGRAPRALGCGVEYNFADRQPVPRILGIRLRPLDNKVWSEAVHRHRLGEAAVEIVEGGLGDDEE